MRGFHEEARMRGPWRMPFPPPWAGHGAPGHFGPGGPGHAHGRGGRGRGGRRANVRAALLALLLERPMHGYEMISELDSRTGGVWRPSPGSVYPTLQMLEDEGLIVSEESDGRKRFSLTDTGRAVDGGAGFVEEVDALGRLARVLQQRARRDAAPSPRARRDAALRIPCAWRSRR